MNLMNDNSWLHKAKSKAIKIVAPLLKFWIKSIAKNIFMQRDLDKLWFRNLKC